MSIYLDITLSTFANKVYVCLSVPNQPCQLGGAEFSGGLPSPHAGQHALAHPDLWPPGSLLHQHS